MSTLSVVSTYFPGAYCVIVIVLTHHSSDNGKFHTLNLLSLFCSSFNLYFILGISIAKIHMFSSQITERKNIFESIVREKVLILMKIGLHNFLHLTFEIDCSDFSDFMWNQSQFSELNELKKLTNCCFQLLLRFSSFSNHRDCFLSKSFQLFPNADKNVAIWYLNLNLS